MAVLPIGFFAPLPLAIMIPFMAAQSFAMGQAFGTSFQYGKRKISSMSNEEFNATSPLILHNDIQSDVRAMIPSMNQSFDRMEKFQIEIIQSMLDTILLGLKTFGDWITGGVGAAGDSVTGSNILPQTRTVATRADIPSIIPRFLEPVVDIYNKNRQPQTSTSNVRDLYKKFQSWSLQDIRAIMKIENRALEKSLLTKVFNEKIAELRKNAPPQPPRESTLVSIQKPMGRNEKLLHDKLIKYFKLYKDGIDTISSWKKKMAFLLSQNRGIGSYRTNIAGLQKRVNLYRDIFNVALKQSRNYKALTSLWGPIKPLQ